MRISDAVLHAGEGRGGGVFGTAESSGKVCFFLVPVLWRSFCFAFSFSFVRCCMHVLTIHSKRNFTGQRKSPLGSSVVLRA